MPSGRRAKKSYFTSRYRTDSPFLFAGEHTSGHIPAEYQNVGLSKTALRDSKDWFDKGSSDLLRELARTFRASSLESGVSRLVIDYNRRLGAKPTSINTFHSSALKTQVLVERGGKDVLVPIPANQGTPRSVRREEERRYARYVKPYLAEGARIVRALSRVHKTVFLVQIHSFEPRYNGDVRSVDIDILSLRSYPDSVARAKRIVAALSKKTRLRVAHNKPWDMESVDGGVFKELQDNPRVVLVPIDVNNKHLRSKAGVRRIARLISVAISEVLGVPLTRPRRRV